MKTKAYINSDQADFLKSQTEVEDLNELNIHATAKKKTSFNSPYSIVFHDSITAISQMGLKPNAYKIVIYLFSKISMGNIIINFSQKKIAQDLGLQPSNVSRAFGQLFEKQILIKDDVEGHTYLNSNLATMGIPKNFNQKTMENLKKSQVETDDFKNNINLFRSTNSKKINKTKPNSKKENIKNDDDVDLSNVEPLF
ncbi:helix-turn-helix domain-containing protein [Klebsiella pneumoniae]|nr:helix-turn-helix domain-containing protein [Klebsiella pneumoniae]MBS8979330.1 helix-turn-helix domain-containing protein [Escherichia coli]